MDTSEAPTHAILPTATNASGEARAWLGERATRAARLGIRLRWLLIAALALGVTVVGMTIILQLHESDMAQLALALALAGLVSAGLGEAALRGADSTRLGSVRLKLIIPSLLTALVIAFNAIAIGQLMFISNMDTQILLLILVFGVAIALAIASSIAHEITTAIRRIESSASRISAGEYSTRIPISTATPGGAKELTSLATSFNQMAANIQQAFEQRDRAEAERRRLIAALSHDLRTPLTTVRAMIEAIDDGVVTDTATIQRYQRATRGELNYLTVLLDDLFELSRLESGALALHRERMPLEEVISNVLEATHEQAEQAGVTLIGRVEGTLPPVLIDARQAQRALTNLAQNALRHTASGGQVLIHASARHDAAGEARVVTQVIDSGEGIAADDLPHIFEWSYRAETSRSRQAPSADGGELAPRSGGAGLGLAITRGVVEAHGGEITAISPLPTYARTLLARATGGAQGATKGAPGAAHGAHVATPGTLFTFALPIADGDW